jgi:hypothetical protein
MAKRKEERPTAGRAGHDPTVMVEINVCAQFTEWDGRPYLIRYPVMEAAIEAWQTRGNIGEPPPRGDLLPDELQPSVGLMLLRVLRNDQGKNETAWFRSLQVGLDIRKAMDEGRAYTCGTIVLGRIQAAVKTFVQAEVAQQRADNLIYPQFMRALHIDPFEDGGDAD